MKKKQVQWKSFNVNMPLELIPIYDFLQNELKFMQGFQVRSKGKSVRRI